MKANSINASAYPPPPPPPPPTSAKSRKALIVALLLVLVVASAIALAYMATGGFNFGTGNHTNPSPSASPSGFATASPSTSPTTTATSSSSSTPSHTPSQTQPTTSTSPTPQPTSSSDNTQAIANLRVGAWANYTIRNYDTDGITVTSEMSMKESIGEGSPSEGGYVGQNCWKIITDQTVEGGTSTSTSIIYLAKNTMQGVRYELWMNNQLIYGYDLNATSTTDPGTSGQIDPNTVISHESCTVPAGTFADCMKAKTTNTFEGTTITSYMWAHQNVPVWGLVKSESYSNNVLTSVMELTAYGG